MRNQTTTSPNPAFQVGTVPLFLGDGTDSGLLATKRLDTNQVFAAVGKQYKVVQNDELMEKAESAFSGLGSFTKKAVLVNGGQKTFIRYDFEGTKIGSPLSRKVGDHILRLELRNSFDGTMKVSLGLALLRLVCSNGMTITEQGFDLQSKHNHTISLENLTVGLEQSLMKFDGIQTLLNQSADTIISQSQGHALLFGLVKRKIMSDRVREAISRIWDKPTYREDKVRNLYNLQNAVTQHLTHGMELGRNKFELANRLSARINATLFNSMRTNNLEGLMSWDFPQHYKDCQPNYSFN